jgi:hypothetical protein
MLRNCRVDSGRLAKEVVIDRANDYARVLRVLLMQPNKVTPVKSQERARIAMCKQQHFSIGPGSTGVPRVSERQDVVTAPAKLHHDWHRKGLVCIRAIESLLRLLVRDDLCLDLVAMRRRIRPGVCQVLGPKHWITTQQLRFANSQSPGLFQYAYWYSSVGNARFAATHVWMRFNPRWILAQFAGNPLKELRLLGAAQLSSQFFDSFQCLHRFTSGT